MQPVRIRKKTGYGRKVVLYILAVSLITVSAVLWLVLKPQPVPDVGTDETGPELTLADHEESQLARITVHPSRSDSYTLVSTESGWKLETDPEYPLREQSVRMLAYYAAHLTADELAVPASSSHAGQARLSDYGLDPAVCSVEVTLRDSTEYTIILGSAAPMDEVRYYAAISGNRSIYTVTSDVMDALNLQFHTLHPVPALAVDAELIDRVSLTGGADGLTFCAERTRNGWRLTAPVRYPLSDSAMESLLSALESLRFSTWVAEDTPQNRREYGFEGDALTLSIDFAPSVLTVPDEEGAEQTFSIPASHITILRGGAYSETADYYLYGGGIMTGTVVTFSFLQRFDWRRYLSPTPFMYGQNNLSSVSVSVNGETAEYTVSYVERVLPNNELETDESGNTVYEMRVRKNGSSVSAEEFSAYYAGLATLNDYTVLDTPQAFEDGSAAGPLAAVVLTPEDRAESIHVAFYPYTEALDYLAVNGTAVMAVPKTWAEAVKAFP